MTLTGAGGVGKTRLAARVAWEVRRTFPDGVWMVELSDLQSPDLLPSVMLEALEIRERSARPPLDVLITHLADVQALLVLDNCEHLLDACAALADALLRVVPATCAILATSREALGIAGEQTWSRYPRCLPSARPVAGRTPRAGSYEAVRLFVERARAVLPDFAVTEDNARGVAQICRRLDGIPLAIELAAARLRALSRRADCSTRLDDRFRLLTGGQPHGRCRASRRCAR